MRISTRNTRSVALLGSMFLMAAAADAANPWSTFPGKDGPGKGKHIVLIAGDEEYRSEEAMPMLGKVLATRHGFDCTVLFSIDPATGTIDPMNQNNIPGLEQLHDSDLMVIATRFRDLPDEQMRHIDEYVHSGKPIIGLRTATHAFKIGKQSQGGKYAHYDFKSTDWPGGFGQQVLGDTWISHHGRHKFESTRGVVDPANRDHPILRGVTDVWGPTDVYGIIHLAPAAKVLLRGQVLVGMSPDDPPLVGPKNEPMMPLAWINPFTGRSGKPARVFATTMGASIDFQSEGLRRLVVNACYWATGLEDAIRADSNVDPVGKFEPTFYGVGAFEKGVRPADFESE